ncbi:sugar ABC transporter ATP-binding protein [Leucobacter sp.]
MSRDTEYAIVCEGVSKKFSGKYAVHRADLRVVPGSVHALVGENGAGKSTLLGMISGRLANDEGRVLVFGDGLRAASPRDSRHHGLAVVYQELTMVPGLSAAQNVFLGQLRSTAGFADDRSMRERFVELCEEFEVRIDPEALARDLSISQQQIVEIMRGVQANGRILMLDEPSAALAESEREVLYRVLSKLRAKGTTIVFVSHNLDEVLALSDHITVMRDSEVVRSAPRDEWTKQTIVRSMVGKDAVIERRAREYPLGDTEVEIAHLDLPGGLHDISISARRGEIIGLWGLVGSGRTTLFRSLFGLIPRARATLRIRGRERPLPRSAREAIAAGIVMVPESRKAALVMGMDSVSNYWLGRRAPGRFFTAPKREEPDAKRVSEFFGFNARRLRDPVRNLSGGNQQKVLLAKWAGRDPSLFLIDEPTRGIDVGAKVEVLDSLRELAAEGATIIVTSSELEEVLAVCDRLLVLAHGRVVHELDMADGDTSVEEILKFGFGESEEAA